MKRLLVTLAVGLAVVGLLYAATLSQAGFECEACMQFEGRQTCRSVVGPTLDEAKRDAISNACALLTSGVTRSLRCSAQKPLRLDCREH